MYWYPNIVSLLNYSNISQKILNFFDFLLPGRTEDWSVGDEAALCGHVYSIVD